MAPIMALIPNIFKATSMNLLFVSTAAELRSLDSKRSWASLPTKTLFRCGFYLNLHQMDKHIHFKGTDALGKGGERSRLGRSRSLSRDHAGAENDQRSLAVESQRSAR